MACLPTSLPVMKDPKFRNDREDFSGSSYQPDKVDANRAKALRGVEEGFKGMEEVLKDGRDWVLGGKEVSLGDVNGEFDSCPIIWGVLLERMGNEMGTNGL